MVERPEPPEHVLSPEYWRGHSFDDNCDFLEGKELTFKRFLSMFREYKRALKVRQTAIDTLKAFMATGDGTILRTFRDEGEIFNGEWFPTGTIIRFSYETLATKPSGTIPNILFHGDPDMNYFWVEGFGIVGDFGTPQEKQIKILAVPMNDHKPYFRLLMIYDPAIYLKTVNHTRIKGGLIQGESMRRFTKVDLLHYGIPTPEEVRRTSGLRQLFPRVT